MEGRRLPDQVEERWPFDDWRPGDYVKLPSGWWVACPDIGMGSFIGILGSGHTVTENADGTITVSPSIKSARKGDFHGYLRNGVWSRV